MCHSHRNRQRPSVLQQIYSDQSAEMPCCCSRFQFKKKRRKKNKKKKKGEKVITILKENQTVCLCFLSSALHSMQRGSRVPGCFTKVQYPCQVKEVLAGQKYTAHTAVRLCWPPESKMSSPKHSFQLYFEVREHIPPHLCLAASPSVVRSCSGW